jgi:hypothetical protein
MNARVTITLTQTVVNPFGGQTQLRYDGDFSYDKNFIVMEKGVLEIWISDTCIETINVGEAGKHEIEIIPMHNVRRLSLHEIA